MSNYLLSIDPSIKNTGFTLGEKIKDYSDYKNNIYEEYGKPIFVKSFNFNKYSEYEFDKNIGVYGVLNFCSYSDFYLIIERGTFHSKNGIGYETQEHLRGFIAGQFNKLLTKNMLISPSEGKSGYIDNYPSSCWGVKGIKELSINLANELINEQNGNIKISNHDEADSLLIGGYYLNKENK